MHTSFTYTDYYYTRVKPYGYGIGFGVRCSQRTRVLADQTARSCSTHRVVSTLRCAWKPNAELAPVRDGLPSAVQVVELLAGARSEARRDRSSSSRRASRATEESHATLPLSTCTSTSGPCSRLNARRSCAARRRSPASHTVPRAAYPTEAATRAAGASSAVTPESSAERCHAGSTSGSAHRAPPGARVILPGRSHPLLQGTRGTTGTRPEIAAEIARSCSIPPHIRARRSRLEDRRAQAHRTPRRTGQRPRRGGGGRGGRGGRAGYAGCGGGRGGCGGGRGGRVGCLGQPRQQQRRECGVLRDACGVSSWVPVAVGAHDVRPVGLTHEPAAELRPCLDQVEHRAHRVGPLRRPARCDHPPPHETVEPLGSSHRHLDRPLSHPRRLRRHLRRHLGSHSPRLPPRLHPRNFGRPRGPRAARHRLGRRGTTGGAFRLRFQRSTSSRVLL
eukprot:scaffold13674_cov61-Phaeocystis_antarctica.AAC.7